MRAMLVLVPFCLESTKGMEESVYYSQALSKLERNCCKTRHELLAIVKAFDHFHPYLYARSSPLDPTTHLSSGY